VKRNDLSTKEVVSGLDVARNSDAIQSPPVSNKVIDTELPGVGVVSLLEDLEPYGSLAIIGLGHVNDAGSPMRRINDHIAGRWAVMVPLQTYGTSGSNRQLSVSRSGGSRQPTACHVIRIDISNRVFLRFTIGS